MPDPEEPIVFDKQRASAFDKQYAKLAPIRDAMHLLIRLILADLPTNARILCVGVGTGAELLDLAKAFSHWQFTALEPAAPMFTLCRECAEEAGIASRCTFHEGYLDTLPAAEPFDAATCLLVSHFLPTPEAQRDLFAKIASRLRPTGYLIASAIASDRATVAYQSCSKSGCKCSDTRERPKTPSPKCPSAMAAKSLSCRPRRLSL